MSYDPRCCGSNACIINAAGRCWCGQIWDGEKMCYPKPDQQLVKQDLMDQPPESPSK